MKILTTVLLLLMSSFGYSQIEATHLRCEYKENPIGIDILIPRLSWQITTKTKDTNLLQTGYQIQVSKNKNDFSNSRHILWDSHKVLSDQSIHVEYQGPALHSRNRYYWRVKIWDNKGRESDWSAAVFWEMGLNSPEEWSANWIAPDLPEDPKVKNPSPMLRKTFPIKKKIKKARLYITSHGLYEAYLNGQKVGDQLFTPGWTSFHKRLQYQTYDVTALLQKKQNAIGVQLGDGWYRGELGGSERRNIYGDYLALLFQLEIEYTNGKKEIITSDDSWKSSTGAIRYSSLYDGECYDARLEKLGWTTAEYPEKNWSKVQVKDFPKNHLIAPQGVPVRAIDTILPIQLLTTPKGEIVIDMGQNMVGRLRLNLQGKKGDTLTIHHSEVLDKQGNFYRDNLRFADQKIQYIFKDDHPVIYEPTYTFMGFRYLKIENYSGTLELEDVQGVVIHSDLEPAGNFECSFPMLNQLQSNILWGQKGNFLDVPTDCPQRDERTGWTGDAQVFAPTACFNFNSAAFYTKWLGDLKADQREDGAVTYVVPDVYKHAGAAGWGDAATVVPWTLYLKYGDSRILVQQFESMKQWVGFFEKQAGDNYLVQEGFTFGDWMFFIHPTDWNNKPGYTDIDLISTAFFAYSSKITAQAASVLGREKAAQRYEELSEKVKLAFQKEYVTPNGRMSAHSQTAYTLALAFDLLNDQQKKAAIDYLVQNIKARNYHLSTGFQGTPHLCHVLSENGHLDVAYKLLFRKKYPSWLYPITKGATTIWERWDGIKPDGSFQAIKANSFNHYAYGAIGDWMYSVMAGINEDPENPGFKHILFRPRPTTDLNFVKASHKSLYGTISASWEIKEGAIELEFKVPPNTTATIILPQKETSHEVGSGIHTYKYRFESK